MADPLEQQAHRVNSWYFTEQEMNILLTTFYGCGVFVAGRDTSEDELKKKLYAILDTMRAHRTRVVVTLERGKEQRVSDEGRR